MFEELDDTLKQTTLRVIEKVLNQFSPDEVYRFALYTSGDFQYLTDSLFTESGLNTVTRKYFDKYDWFREQTGTYEEGKRRLRWSPCDSPQHLLPKKSSTDQQSCSLPFGVPLRIFLILMQKVVRMNDCAIPCAEPSKSACCVHWFICASLQS
jgi:hypothetical protein